jgi:hypothetical protein
MVLPKKKDPDAPRRGCDMSGSELTEALRLLKIKQTHLAQWFRDDPRKIRRYCNENSVQPVDVPEILAVLVRLMLARPELIEGIEGIALGDAGPIVLAAMPGTAPVEKPKRARKAGKTTNA